MTRKEPFRPGNAVASLILSAAVSENPRIRRRLSKSAARLLVADAAESALNAGQVGLDVAGLVPGIGEAADAINALISLLRKDYLGAALSLISMVPAIGDAIGKSGKVALWVSKLAKQQGKLGKAGQFLLKNGPKVKAGLKTFAKVLAENKDTIVAGLGVLSSLIAAVGKGAEAKTDPNAPPALNAAARVIGKSKKLQDLAAKAAPHLPALRSATAGLLQLATASDTMFAQLEARAKQEAGAASAA